MKRKLVVLDGQGGGVGRKIAERLLREGLDAEFLVVGANATATSNMMKAGVAAGATGENAWMYNCARADLLVGPMGIILANAMHGEISPAMALAVANSPAQRILVPVPNRHIHIAGFGEQTLTAALEETVKLVVRCLAE